MDENIMVSICCITYNQEKYIRETIDSFLMQKTNFKYEVIIHDDCSTDSTTKIIKEYEKKYPNIIKPIYEEENQMSKGKVITFMTYRKAKGKYIALCEGDDFWIDENKLQKQVDYMEKYNQCTLCFHNAKELYMKRGIEKKYIDKKYEKKFTKDGIYHADNILSFGQGGAIPTASLMFREKDAEKFMELYTGSYICTDMPLKLFMSAQGYAYFINEVMSVYRRETGQSLTDNWTKDEEFSEKKVIRLKKFIDIIDDFNKYTNFKYDDGLKETRKKYEVDILYSQKNFKEVFSKKYRKYYKEVYNDRFYIKFFFETKNAKFIRNRAK